MAQKTAKPKKERVLSLQTPKGMHDILPHEQPWRERVSQAAKELAAFYGFSRIDTPILEYAALFERGVGEETDIVEKEMYLVKTKGGDLLALRPEGTAAVARAYLEHHMSRLAQPQKFFYEGPFFRHENPQAGRFREFRQVGFEILGGSNDPIYDAQAILVFARLLEELKVRNTLLKINSIGCRVCRPPYKEQLQEYYRRQEKKLCVSCVRRRKTQPLRLLDCKEPGCEELRAKTPNVLDRLCAACSAHLKTVLEYLDELAVPYNLHNTLVRGLDYYSRTVFEFFVEGPGAEIGSLGGGGRYDYLVEMLGGKSTPGVGWSAGVERVIHVMRAQQVKLPARTGKKVFLIHVSDLAKKKSLTLIEKLRQAGIAVAETLDRESLKAQLRHADREEADLALIIGQKEIFDGTVIVRDLRSSLQETVPLRTLVEEIKSRLRRQGTPP